MFGDFVQCTVHGGGPTNQTPAASPTLVMSIDSQLFSLRSNNPTS
jgi:hypothetical protein